jgi:cellulose 1,4-beta-cellobiosidase
MGGFVTGGNVGSRTYLYDAEKEQYQMFKLKNREFTFDVDVSALPCGVNGALYFVQMAADGGKSQCLPNWGGPGV